MYIDFWWQSRDSCAHNVNDWEGRPHSVSITEFGAVGDGKTLNTHAFDNAMFYLRTYADKGGVQLYIPAGQWLTGSINLISHLTLFLENGATILGSEVGVQISESTHVLLYEWTLSVLLLDSGDCSSIGRFVLSVWVPKMNSMVSCEIRAILHIVFWPRITPLGSWNLLLLCGSWLCVIIISAGCLQNMDDYPIIPGLPSYGRGRELPGPRHSSLINGEGLVDVIITGTLCTFIWTI